MNDGISFLKDVKQNFVQFGTLRQLNMSKEAYGFSLNGIPEDEHMMIYKGYDPTIEISSNAEFERFKATHFKNDPRAYEHGLLFCTNDMDKVTRVVRICLDYYMDKDYEAAMDGMIEALSPKQSRTLQPGKTIDNK